MKHTMLTTDTLSRFEKCININFLTEEAIKKIEYYAYCANMGAESEKKAWEWFKHLMTEDFEILLPEFADTED